MQCRSPHLPACKCLLCMPHRADPCCLGRTCRSGDRNLYPHTGIAWLHSRTSSTLLGSGPSLLCTRRVPGTVYNLSPLSGTHRRKYTHFRRWTPFCSSFPRRCGRFCTPSRRFGTHRCLYCTGYIHFELLFPERTQQDIFCTGNHLDLI